MRQPMKIAYVLSPSCLFSNVVSGIVVQAKSWARGLQELGQAVEFPAADKATDWASFDVVHLYQHGPWSLELLKSLQSTPVKVVHSPIIDPPTPYGLLASLVSRLPFEKLRMMQNQRLLRVYGRMCDVTLARSQHEATSLKAVGVPASRISSLHIPLANSWQVQEADVIDHPRSDAVFHVSHLSQPRKNVAALIALAIEEGFRLRLAGSISDDGFAASVADAVKKHPNIAYLGRISDEQMREEMLSCAVFCLPSLHEGVGLVALDAAYCGANLVVTARGGTPEYLGRCATVVDPRDIATLKSAVLDALRLPRPNLTAHRYAVEHFSPRASAEKLLNLYEALSSKGPR